MNIEPRNNKGQPHGYWKMYDMNGKLWYEGAFVNGKSHGLWKWYMINGKVSAKKYYLR